MPQICPQTSMYTRNIYHLPLFEVGHRIFNQRGSQG